MFKGVDVHWPTLATGGRLGLQAVNTKCVTDHAAIVLKPVDLVYKERLGDVQGAAALQQVSPVAWQHINLYGRYEFRKGPEAINLPALIQELGHAPVPHDLVV
jgi:hypothetical protein